VTPIEGLELALAIAGLILAVIDLAGSKWRSLTGWALVLCLVIWILRLVPGFHGG
jgi:hypothetical protein